MRTSSSRRCEDVVRSQVRFPDSVYKAVRHVAAANESSINQTVISLLSEALESHHDQLPKNVSSRLRDSQQAD